MAEPSVKAAAPRPTRADVCDQIGRSVGTLWARRFGVRPESVSTEYEGDVVRCAIHAGESPAADGDEEGQEEAGTIGTSTYERKAQAEVARLTGRRVLAFVAKPSKDAVSTNAFVLEPVLIKY